MTTSAITATDVTGLTIDAVANLESAAHYVFQSLSESSRRVYQRTFTTWAIFARDNGFDPLALSYDNVAAFINQADVGKSTRQNRLSHIRKLVKVLAQFDTRYQRHADAINALLRVKRTQSDSERKGHSKRALSDAELIAVLDVWRYDTSRVGLRNNALIRLLVFTGLRRSEVAALQWTDVDMDSMTLTVQHGKGDKARVVAIADPSSATKTTLQALQTAMERYSPGTDYQHIFPRMTAHANPHFADDDAIDSQTVLSVVTATAKRSGIGHISPHDLRRTHITSALNAGATVADMQAQAGHASAATTLIYAQASEAQERRKRIRFNVS